MLFDGRCNGPMTPLWKISKNFKDENYGKIS